MKLPFSQTQPDNTPSTLASELAAAREAYVATRESVIERASQRIYALDEIIDEAQDERAAVVEIMNEAAEN